MNLRSPAIIVCTFILSFYLFECQSPRKQKEETAVETVPRFPLKRGVNISHWLSQSKVRGHDREFFFTKKDVDFIDSIGYDHFRIPIDEEQMWDEMGNKEPEAFELLHRAIDWALKRELKLIVDLHILRSHYFNARVKPLWTDSTAQEQFLRCWRDLSEELKGYPTHMVAYELMNEPVADKADDWNSLVSRAVKVIRENEPQRFIVIGSNKWQSVHTFDELIVPENDPYIILSFHFYNPFLLTHHKAGWTEIGSYDGPVNYPGLLVEDDDIAGIDNNDLRQKISDYNGVFTRDSIEKMMQAPIRKARKLNLQLYCGEWGCLPTVPRESLLAWYSDMRGILEDNQIGWTNWDYKGGFGILDRNNEYQPINDLIDVLLY